MKCFPGINIILLIATSYRIIIIAPSSLLIQRADKKPTLFIYMGNENLYPKHLGE
jgi:hypothetical protein